MRRKEEEEETKKEKKARMWFGIEKRKCFADLDVQRQHKLVAKE